jgi:heterodisulfide reductase subunit C
MGSLPVTIVPDEAKKKFIRQIEQESGTRISLCYQCGKCSAGCPAGFGMRYAPRQVIRMLQLWMIDEALQAESIWLCVTCETCTSRCPQGVDVASLMDALRREALKRKIVTNRRIAAFNEIFLKSVASFGRVFEAGLLLQHNLQTGQLLKDVELGLPMMQRGKMRMLPPLNRGRNAVRQIYARVKRMEAEKS